MASSNSKHPVALTIAGSDPGGGAGLQADVKTFAALGVYGYSVITEVIAQNSIRVGQVENVSPEMVEAQLNILALECAPRAVKTGALANAAIVKAVARTLERLKMPAPVVDPVIVSSSGALLIGPKGERAIRNACFRSRASSRPTSPRPKCCRAFASTPRRRFARRRSR